MLKANTFTHIIRYAHEPNGPVAGNFEIIHDEDENADLILPLSYHLVYMCPCGCDQLRAIPIKTGPKELKYWQWDGNRERPTLSPSIQHLDNCSWHGFLEAGMWRTV